MPTIKDVAKHANVSVATVSRVLNENGYVNEDTREKVLESINKLDYQPNELARTLYTRRSRMIGLIVPDITNPFFPELARAVEDVTNAKNYTFILCNSDDQVLKEKNYIDVLRKKYVDGFIIVTSTLTNDHLEGINTPVVALDRNFEPDIPCVSADNYHGAKLAVEHLHNIGCKKIAHVAGPEFVMNAQHRLRGYLDMVADKPFFSEDLVVNGDYHLQNAKEATMNLLKAHPDIDGIFVGNDLMAVGVLKAAETLAIKVPDQLSIVGFDGITLGETTSPALTTIAQPIYDMGAKATNLLMDMIEGKPVEETEYTFPVQLVERESAKKGMMLSE
ncbi:ribose operon transcriptional repressor RbsR [Salinibacillus aidingensis]|uniref:Ribose operon transcriptional repressor RbsR n=1 Tax=Salinibacillus aidingensis TaxID=237684 RepID=A0ABN1AYS4_9BACI